MKKFLCILFLFCGCTVGLDAQDLIHSLYSFTDNRINPALASTDDYQRANFLFRKQYATENVSFLSSYAEFKQPFFNSERRWSGLNISFLNDKTEGDEVYSFNQISSSFAINIPINEDSEIAIGLNMAYQSRAINSTGLTTGSQYVEYLGFDPSRPSGEGAYQENINYFTYAAGIFWQKIDRFGNQIYSAGYSLNKLNRPSTSFYSSNEEPLPMQSILTATIRLHQDYLWGIRQDVLLSKSGAATELVSGPALYYALDNMGRKKLNFMLRYSTANNMMAGAVYESENFAFGGSYDLNIMKNNVSNNSAFEVMLSLKRIRQPKNKKSKSRKRSKTKRDESIHHLKKAEIPQKDILDTKNEPEKNIEEENENEEVITVETEAGIITYYPHELENLNHSFFFDFDDVTLNEEDALYIKDMTAILRQNKNVKILITGYTDNIGSEEYNMKLSFKRAKIIGLLLVKNGISKKQIKLQARGEENPIDSNETAEGRAKNRRVEVNLIYN
ncbi:PorP/SprF family type IX secretion system membrane protein [Marivirga sp. S37H4]|uniref:PorP/SprF family type IX secretion system membrane protein n=1 Tax=Marivirga aurantiaca TaxID=2802615 RepID=A0A934WYX9_9BACT|nr:PorP/SprF family type IX secretion system membrane protein [Marivirga aurantiaca]MBK6265457.1 PorP/SprF family type IX secretion system membrane protein [Marivirga aurantiaca]